MQQITEDLLEKDNYFLYIHTPFCGTCHIARAMLSQIETTLDKQVFYEMNASYYESFMQTNKIKSVPCLLIKVNGQIQEKVYVFHSISNIIHYLWTYSPDIFSDHKY